MRLLPTSGRCMVNEHFADLMNGDLINSPLIWECARFCLARHATRLTSNALMLAGGEVMVGFGVKQCVVVFDQRMIRIYRMIGAQPKILGQTGEGKDFIGVGMWSFTDELRQRVAKIAGISPLQSRQWFDLAFGPDQRLAQVG